MNKKRHKTTHKENLNRLSRIEGQVKAVRRMVEEEAYCIDIITQIQAAQAALGAVGRRILHKHLDHCVADALRSKSRGDVEEKIQELMKVVKRRHG